MKTAAARLLLFYSLKKLPRGQHEKEIVRGAAAHHVFRLLPEIREFQKLRKIRTDQRRAGDDAAGNVRPVRAVGAVGDRGGARADTGGEGGGVRAGMTAEDEMQRAVDQLRWEQLRERAMQEVIVKGQLLNVPACTPDARPVGNPVGRLGTLGRVAGGERKKRLADGSGKTAPSARQTIQPTVSAFSRMKGSSLRRNVRYTSSPVVSRSSAAAWIFALWARPLPSVA